MSTNLSVSFELICLMGWLLKKDRPALQALVQKALAGGVAENIAQLQSSKPSDMSDTMLQTISDFFEYIETLLVQGSPSKNDTFIASQLVPEVARLDQHIIDARALWLAINKTRETYNDVSEALNETERQSFFKQELYKNLLAYWNLSSQEVLH